MSESTIRFKRPDPPLTARRDGALVDDGVMSTSGDDLPDRINAADRFRRAACQDYNTKLDALASTGSQAQEIERLRTVCDDAKIRLDRVKAGGQFVESVDEALAILPPGASMVVAPNTVPFTVSAVEEIPASDVAILLTPTDLNPFTVQLQDIVSVEFLAIR
jgi:hypothetical protein